MQDCSRCRCECKLMPWCMQASTPSLTRSLYCAAPLFVRHTFTTSIHCCKHSSLRQACNTFLDASATDVDSPYTPCFRPKEGLFGLKAWLNEPWLLNWLVKEDIQMSDFLGTDMAASHPPQELLKKRTRWVSSLPVPLPKSQGSQS